MANDPVQDILEQCCVQIRTASGVGSGFFVAPKLVITCAHVLTKDAAVGASAELRLRGQGDWLAARVMAIAKADEDDLAVLNVDAQADIYPVLDEDDDVVSKDELMIFGFPKYALSEPQRSDHLLAQFVSTTGLTHLPNRVLHKFASNRVVGGYSGSPALNLMTGKVIGVVSETVDPKAEAGGWAIRSVLLAELFPDVAAQNRRIARTGPWLQQIDALQNRRESRSRRLPPLPLTRYLNWRVSKLEEVEFLNAYARCHSLGVNVNSTSFGDGLLPNGRSQSQYGPDR